MHFVCRIAVHLGLGNLISIPEIHVNVFDHLKCLSLLKLHKYLIKNSLIMSGGIAAHAMSSGMSNHGQIS